MCKKRWVLGICIFGLIIRLFTAVHFQSRAWIDELWVVLNPSVLFAFGWGQLQADWVYEIRSWVPPVILGSFLKFLSLLGIKSGLLVLALVRVLFTLASFAALCHYAWFLCKKFKIEQPLFLLVLLFVPEFIHYSALADLSVFALPFLLSGLAFALDDSRRKWPMRAGYALLSLSVLIRFQFIVVPVILFLDFLRLKKWRELKWLTLVGSAFLAADFALNSAKYGHPVFVMYRYFKVNIFDGMASGFGESSFFHSFEILWRFVTEPVFLLIVATAPFLLRQQPLLAAMGFGLFFAHAVIGHKEYRFFYGPAVLLTAHAGVAFQKWVQEMDSSFRWSDKNVRRNNTVIAAFSSALSRFRSVTPLPFTKKAGVHSLFVILFLSFAIWRGFYKTRWTDYQIPSQLETWVGARADVTGLMTVGWGGIYSGGAYTFYRELPYIFAENGKQLAERLQKNPEKNFNYLIASKAAVQDGVSCSKQIREETEAVVFFCTLQEVIKLQGDGFQLSSYGRE